MLLFDKINIALVVVALVYLLLALLILYRGRGKQVRNFYSLVIFSVILWTLGMFFYRSASAELSLFWCRVLYILATFTASSFFLFSYVFPENKFPSVKKIIFSGILNSFIVILVLVPNIIIKDVNIIEGEEKNIIWGRWYFLYFLYISGLFLSGLIVLLKKHLRSTGIAKLQLKYVFGGYLLGSNLAMFTNLLMVWWGDFRFNWLGQILSAFMVGFTVYSIVRHRLMDIRLLVTRSILYFLLIIYVAGLYTFLTFIAGELLVERAGVSSSFIPLFIAFVIVIGLDPLKRILTKYTDKLFYKGRIDYQKVLRHLSEVIALEINLDHLLDSILEILNRELKIKNGVILLADKQGKFFKPESFLDGRKSVILDDKSPLIRYLKKDKNLIITEELIRMTDDAKTPTEKNYLERVRKDLEDLDCALCLPVIIDKKLTSVVIVGPKLSGDMFSFEDVRLFEVLAPQMAAAIEKAKLYEEVQDFSITLQQKVEKATHELQEANIHLRQLDKAKSEFLSIAAHQLRTPISGIKGYLSMLLDGDFGTLDEKKRKVMRTVFNSTERLNRLVNVFLNISRIESGRLKLSPSPVVVEELVESAINNFKIVAQRKKIELEFIKPKKKTKPINIDRDKITDVVNNLIDNSIKYTEKGKIAVQVKQEKGQVMFAVKDTGIGMAEEDLSGMFNKFSRTSASERINTGGSGLGLYIAKRLVEAHGGKIWAKSPGRGQGSTFMFSLPIK